MVNNRRDLKVENKKKNYGGFLGHAWSEPSFFVDVRFGILLDFFNGGTKLRGFIAPKTGGDKILPFLRAPTGPENRRSPDRSPERPELDYERKLREKLGERKRSRRTCGVPVLRRIFSLQRWFGRSANSERVFRITRALAISFLFPTDEWKVESKRKKICKPNFSLFFFFIRFTSNDFSFFFFSG